MYTLLEMARGDLSVYYYLPLQIIQLTKELYVSYFIACLARQKI